MEEATPVVLQASTCTSSLSTDLKTTTSTRSGTVASPPHPSRGQRHHCPGSGRPTVVGYPTSDRRSVTIPPGRATRFLCRPGVRSRGRGAVDCPGQVGSTSSPPQKTRRTVHPYRPTTTHGPRSGVTRTPCTRTSLRPGTVHINRRNSNITDSHPHLGHSPRNPLFLHCVQVPPARVYLRL